MKFCDTQGVPAFNYQMMEELKETNPELVIRRFNLGATVDKRDTGLRVPMRVVEKKEKKKKKKK